MGSIITALFSSAYTMMSTPEFWVTSFVIAMYMFAVKLIMFVLKWMFAGFNSDSSQDTRNMKGAYVPERK